MALVRNTSPVRQYVRDRSIEPGDEAEFPDDVAEQLVRRPAFAKSKPAKKAATKPAQEG